MRRKTFIPKVHLSAVYVLTQAAAVAKSSVLPKTFCPKISRLATYFFFLSADTKFFRFYVEIWMWSRHLDIITLLYKLFY